MVSKKKKSLACVLSLLVILMFGCQIVNAADEIQTRGPMAYCSKCGTTTGHTIRTDRTYKHDEYFTCIHGTGGRDRYAVYEVKTIITCTRCGNAEVSDKYDDHVFKGCVK